MTIKERLSAIEARIRIMEKLMWGIMVLLAAMAGVDIVV